LLLGEAWSSASDEERRGSRWLIIGAAVAIIPFVGAPIGSRCLVLPMLGGSVAVAFVLRRWWRALWQRPGVPYRLISAGCVLLIAIHLAIAPLVRLGTPYAIRRALHDRLATAMAETELDGEHLGRQRIVVLRAPDFIVGLH